MNPIQRIGIDHDPVVPWNWASLPFREAPVEICSWPIPHPLKAVADEDATIMVRMTVGDPTSIKEVPLKLIAAFEPYRHEWFYRPKKYYSDNPTAFIFTDEA